MGRYVADTLRRSPCDVCLNVMPLFHIHGLIANVGVHQGAVERHRHVYTAV